MKTVSRLALLLLASTLATGLKAQDPSYRVQVMLCTAEGQLKEITGNRFGYDLGAHALYTLQPGEYLRPRVDLMFFPELKVSGIQNTGSNLSFGCDFIQHFKGSASPLFVTGGLALIRWSESTDNAPIAAGSGDTTRMGLAAGFGYKVNENITYELRYVRSSLSKEFKTATLGIGLTVRF